LSRPLASRASSFHHETGLRSFGRVGMRTVSRWVALKIVLLTLAIYFAAAVTYVAVDAAVNQLWVSGGVRVWLGIGYRVK
jgi:hypothetical protein